MTEVKKVGNIIILSSPSGAGKTTLVKKISKNKNFFTSISHTTRAPRLNEKHGKDYKKELGKKVLEYTPQLHGYSMLYSNLETDEMFLAENSRATKPDKIKESVRNTLSKIKTIEVKKTSLLGLVFIYPEKLLNEKNIIIDFSYRFEPVDYDIETFKGLITEYLDMLHNPKFPKATKDCGNCSYLIDGGRLINEK